MENKNKEHNNILKIGSKNLNTENWKVFHPTGRHMFTCGEKKAEWYLERNLAVISGDKEIIFTFDPKGMGFEDNEEFGRGIRETICVVSGVGEGLQRHHIVPYCYRSYFPEEYKSKNHHDVVLINHELHSDYEQVANTYKDEIAGMFNVKTITELNIDYTSKLREIGKPTSMILNTLHSIFMTYGKVSNKTYLDKLTFISQNSNMSFDELRGFNYVQLYKLYLLLKEENESEIGAFKDNYRHLYDHGYHVVNQLDTEEKITEFVKLWRKHFIDVMQPKFMPNGWSVDFRIKTKVT